MLMESCVGTAHGTDFVKKSRTLDLQKLCRSKLWASTSVESRPHSGGGGRKGLKRKIGSKDQNGARKRVKKEVLLSSLSSGAKSNECVKDVFRGRLNGGKPGGKSGLDADKKKDNCSGSLGGNISLSLNGDVSIPKRRRDLVRRRKVVGDVRLKQEGASSSKVSSATEGAQSNECYCGNLLRNGNDDEKVVQNGGSEGLTHGSFSAKMKRKKNSDCKESRPYPLLCLKGDKSHSSAQNGGSLNKKASRSHKKTKKANTSCPGLTKEIKQVLDQCSKICDESQEDEENLEANAARMLSSRFDPSCTGFSSGGKSPEPSSSNGLSALPPLSRDSAAAAAAAEPFSGAGCEPASVDTEAKVSRPKSQLKGKKTRRYYYEVVFRDVDSYWVINHRIKVFWPLDQCWYFGRVIGYDPEKKVHHLKYDDREEEWVDLQNERFKLLLLPSEVPEKAGRKKSRMHDSHARKGKHDETLDKEVNSNSCMESEPIISWLARSNRCKSPPFGVRKKQKACNVSAKSQLSFSDGRIDPGGSLEVGSSGRNVDDSVCSSVLHKNSHYSLSDRKPLVEKLVSDRKKTQIVYYRKRFHKRETPPIGIHGECQLSSNTPIAEPVPEVNVSLDLDNNMFDYIDLKLSPDELIWNTDDSGFLKLAVPVTSLKVFQFESCFSLPALISKLFRGQAFFVMLHHGTVISLWPRVHLEMLFVDNIVGLRFLLFEGCFIQAVLFVCLIMVVFNQSNQKGLDQQLPVTSIRFRLFGAQDLHKQLIFTFYNFREVSDSKWSYLDRKLNRHCLLIKQLPPSKCTYDNVMALHSRCNSLPSAPVSHQPSSLLRLWKRSRQPKMKMLSRQSALLNLSQLSCDRDVKHGERPAFALSFAAAPTFFISLHLKLLMERSIPSSSFLEHGSASLMEHSEDDGCLVSIDRISSKDNPTSSSLTVGSNLGSLASGRSEMESYPSPNLKSIASMEDCADRLSTKLSHGSHDSDENESAVQSNIRNDPPSGTEHGVPSTQHDVACKSSPVKVSVGSSSLKGSTVEIPSCDSVENDAVVSRTQSIWHQNKGSLSASMNMSLARSDGKQDLFRNGFGHGPKKPRTQVSYSLPLGGQDHNSKSKFYHAKGFSHKRIRKSSEKKTSEAFRDSQKNTELLSCDANVLVTAGDRGWRECGARVVLEVVDTNEWRLAVKGVGDSKYSYKAQQFMQPGSTNRYTLAMMWKGGKDWTLEFPDRTQWAKFKVLYEECYNRNLRAASVKNIPIPGVRLIEENDDNLPETPFVRPSPRYYRHTETDVDIAMDPSRVLYNMDSDDEQWIGNYRGLESNKSICRNMSDEMFEKAIDVFEKVSYAKQCDHISFDELEEDMAELGPLETIKAIYEHWREKRRRKGMPLLRHLQPPLWEKYQQQVKEWEQAVMKCNATLSNGSQDKPITPEKPPMFAFCLKPRGLEVPHRGSKQRSQKRLPLGALSHAVSVDLDGFYSLGGRRSNGYAFGEERIVSGYNHGVSDTSPVLQGSSRVFSPKDVGGVGYLSLSSDGSEKNHYPKLSRNKSRKLCLIPPSNDNQTFAFNSQKNMTKRNASHGWNVDSSEWSNQMHYVPDGFQRHCFEQLDPSGLDEFRLRDAASAARHAVAIAKMKRENAQRMVCRADLAIHKAVSAIMTAEAVEASYKEPQNDV